MLLVIIAPIIVVIDLMQFIRWVALSRVYINAVLDGIITKMQCSVFHVKIAMNTVPGYMITSILSLKSHVCILHNL